LAVRIEDAGVDGVRASRANRKPSLRTVSGSAGLTLIEMAVTVAIVAIVAAISTPSFLSFIQSNRVQSEVNSMVNSLQLARSEAIKRGQSVSICPSSNGSSCLGAITWNVGWLVFVDRNADGVVDTPANAADLLQYRAPWAGTDIRGHTERDIRDLQPRWFRGQSAGRRRDTRGTDPSSFGPGHALHRAQHGWPADRAAIGGGRMQLKTTGNRRRGLFPA
jgi:prepilin-type N-terminal cleavage/methylation domain-containing protein